MSVVPFAGVVMLPCDWSGNVTAKGLEPDAHLHFETKAFCIAWFGQVVLWPFGEVTRRRHGERK